jgi:hypothetical protein
MINNDNNQDPEEKKTEDTATVPDESSGIAVQGFLKIFDPESGEILAQGRA